MIVRDTILVWARGASRFISSFLGASAMRLTELAALTIEAGEE